MEPIKHNFLALPTDIHRLYFDLLDEDGLHRASQVCKRYKILSEEYFLKFFKAPFLEADLSKPLKPQLALHYNKFNAALLSETIKEVKGLKVFQKRKIIVSTLKTNALKCMEISFGNLFFNLQSKCTTEEERIQALIEIAGTIPERAVTFLGKSHSPLEVALAQKYTDPRTIKIISYFTVNLTKYFSILNDSHSEEIAMNLIGNVQKIGVFDFHELYFSRTNYSEKTFSVILDKLVAQEIGALKVIFTQILLDCMFGKYSTAILSQFIAKFPQMGSSFTSDLEEYLSMKIDEDFLLLIINAAEKPFGVRLLDLSIETMRSEKVVRALLDHTEMPEDSENYLVNLMRHALTLHCDDGVILALVDKFIKMPSYIVSLAELYCRSPHLINQLKERIQTTNTLLKKYGTNQTQFFNVTN